MVVLWDFDNLFVSMGMVLGPVIGGFIYDYSKIMLFDFNAVMFFIRCYTLDICACNGKETTTSITSSKRKINYQSFQMN